MSQIDEIVAAAQKERRKLITWAVSALVVVAVVLGVGWAAAWAGREKWNQQAETWQAEYLALYDEYTAMTGEEPSAPTPAQVAERGPQGEPGAAGPVGPVGASGKDGKDGSPGVAGLPGLAGADGAKGADGVNGKDGSNGRDGVDGVNGVDGAQGPAGPAGPQGEPGLPGLPGLSAFPFTFTFPTDAGTYACVVSSPTETACTLQPPTEPTPEGGTE